MTLGEVLRYIEAYESKEKQRMREKAYFDYRLADLIGVSIGRYYAKSFSYPEIFEVYPAFYTEEEIEDIRQEERDKQSIERLKRLVNNKQ